MRKKFTHLDFRVAPPQRCTWGRSPITVSRTGLEFARRCACSDPGGRRREGKVPLSHCTKASLKKPQQRQIINSILIMAAKKTKKHPHRKGLDGHFFSPFKSEMNINEITVNKLRGRWRFGPAEWSRSWGLCCVVFPQDHCCPIDHRSIILFTLYSNTDSEREEEMPIWEKWQYSYNDLKCIFCALTCEWPDRTWWYSFASSSWCL